MPRVNGPPPRPPTGLAQKRNGRIAFFQMNDGEYQKLLEQDCTEAARRCRMSLEVFCGDNDATKQVSQMQACLKKPMEERPTAMIVSPVREIAILSVAYAAAQAGVGIVVLLRTANYIRDLHKEFPHLPIFSVLCDQWEIGRLQGRFFRALLPQGGEIVYVRGPLGTSSATRRFEGVQQVLTGSSLELFTITSDWTFEGGAAAMREWLKILEKRTLPRFVIGAQNDAMAMGARSALAEFAGRRSDIQVDRIPVFGCDGSPDFGLRLVKEGKLTGTVIMPPGAGRAVVEITSMLNGGPQTPVEIELRPIAFPDVAKLEGTWNAGRAREGSGAK
jgi:ABC-type sugar transport system substrate-binding protein